MSDISPKSGILSSVKFESGGRFFWLVCRYQNRCRFKANNTGKECPWQHAVAVLAVRLPSLVKAEGQPFSSLWKKVHIETKLPLGYYISMATWFPERSFFCAWYQSHRTRNDKCQTQGHRDFQRESSNLFIVVMMQKFEKCLRKKVDQEFCEFLYLCVFSSQIQLRKIICIWICVVSG